MSIRLREIPAIFWEAPWRGAVLLVIYTIALVAALTYAQGGWNYAYSSTSPDGKYRVDIYRANRWQSMTYGIAFDDPGFARLTRVIDNESLGTSSVFTLLDSRVTWLPDVVQVGTQTGHRLPQGSWD